MAGIRFAKVGKKEYFTCNDIDIKCGQEVLVEMNNETRVGTVWMISREDSSFKKQILQNSKILRVVNEDDKRIIARNKRLEKEAITECAKLITKHKLDMHLIDGEYSFNKGKLVFYFSSSNRVDFRNLVKDLASIFHTRIELRQVGVRDEARLIGGLGPCGRPLCCTIFMSDFEPISIKMAKEQRLSLNPVKISGICGRLMCCLKYETDELEAIKVLMPDLGQSVETAYGAGEVLSINFEEKIVRIKLGDGQREIDFHMNELKIFHK